MAPRIAALAVASAALLTFACDAPRLRRTVQQERRQAEAEIERKLLELDQRIERLRVQAQNARKARTDLLRRIRDLQERGHGLRRELRDAQREGERALDDTLGSVDRAMNELEEALGLAESDEAAE